MSVDRPSCYIFLDTDGVLIGNRFKSPLKEQTEQKICELFGLKNQYSRLEWKQAASHFLDPTALTNLNNLVARIEKFMQPNIICSSEWRIGISLDQLKNLIFNNTGLSQLFLDKTAEDDLLRSEQINNWLQLNIVKNDAFVILDDANDDLGIHFPSQFVKINPNELFTTEKANEAYEKVIAQLNK